MSESEPLSEPAGPSPEPVSPKAVEGAVAPEVFGSNEKEEKNPGGEEAKESSGQPEEKAGEPEGEEIRIEKERQEMTELKNQLEKSFEEGQQEEKERQEEYEKMYEETLGKDRREEEPLRPEEPPKSSGNGEPDKEEPAGSEGPPRPPEGEKPDEEEPEEEPEERETFKKAWQKTKEGLGFLGGIIQERTEALTEALSKHRGKGIAGKWIDRTVKKTGDIEMFMGASVGGAIAGGLATAFVELFPTSYKIYRNIKKIILGTLKKLPGAVGKEAGGGEADQFEMPLSIKEMWESHQGKTSKEEKK